jgi:thymidylate synthase (FAD)
LSVELIDSMGDDLRIVNAARVSFSKQSTWAAYGPDGGELREADEGLIGYLMRNRHGTPFEMVVMTFRVTVPIGVAREWQRHRIGSFNEVSTRYVEMQPDFYVPELGAVRKQVGKAGHYRFETMDASDAQAVQVGMRQAYAIAYATYQDLLRMGVAKELARNVLPVGLMTSFYWTVNLRSLLNFLSLRTHETALLEIRQEATEVERLACSVAPAAMAAWDVCGRQAP